MITIFEEKNSHFLAQVRHNWASRGAIEGKEKSFKFNPRDDEQVESSPALRVWSHEGSVLDPKIAQ